MNLEMGVKLHNRFDIEVKDIRTGRIVQRAQAENIVLNAMYTVLNTLSTNGNVGKRIYYGSGIGVLDPTRTALFNQINYKLSTNVEFVYNLPPLASYGKKKIVLLPEEAIGETITEVGIASSAGVLETHALLKDSEGNQISIGPKTETQEITIYATIYAEISTTDGMLILTPGSNILLSYLCGFLDAYSTLASTDYRLILSSDKSATDQAKLYPITNMLASIPISFNVADTPNRKVSTGRKRFGTTDANGKIWSAFYRHSNSSSDRQLFRILFPSALWPGYHFENEPIGIGDGVTATFNLPWSDINESKGYTIYVNGVAKTKDVHYTLSNSESITSITITAENIPASNEPITGDWWVDYVPKDDQHVLDVTFTIQYGEGV